jgi:hypothetical protein
MPVDGEHKDWGELGETEKGLKRIKRAYERRVQWTSYTEAKLRMLGASL